MRAETTQSTRASGDEGRAKRAERGLGRLLNEQPLLVGLVAVLVGAFIALLLPRTQREDRLMGQQSDGLIGRVKEVAEATFESVKETASQEFSGLSEEVKGAAQKTAERAADAAQETAHQAADTAKESAQQSKSQNSQYKTAKQVSR